MRAANALSKVSRVAASALATCADKSLMPCITKVPMTNGAAMPASLLQIPMMAMRCAAPSIGPKMLM